jgi:long-subunit fatty acid transport protein
LSYQDKYEGSGGINQVFWGNAFRLSKNLSIGINANFLFGSIEKIAATEFPDSATYFSSRNTKTTYIQDFYFSYGIQYFKPLKHDLTFSAGAVFSKSSKISATQDILSETYTTGSGNIILARDTVDFKEGLKGNIIIPTNFGFGLSLKKSDIWLVAADYQWQNWNKFKSFNETDSLKNSWRTALGAQYVPQKAIFPRIFDRIEYRLGFHYSKTYLELRNNQLNEMGFSFGIGLPLRKSKSIINFGMEVGRQGTTANNLMQENYFRFSLSVSLSERWFIKSKYD